MRGRAGGYAWWGGGLLGRGHAWKEAGETALAVGGMHPTGMHSCSGYFSRKQHEINKNWTGEKHPYPLDLPMIPSQTVKIRGSTRLAVIVIGSWAQRVQE